ncbi:endonuclease [Xenorhabdus szentirmaii]|uniref:Transposase n=1 Tax=Xenorhabdus szentirmaii DSM 16338 TaxID=1427518 RepID=W1J3E8_9GAMM|nr:endonuclease [Xenorhabdus szentirmaii DSM 16338]PHM44341.1 endonuclease [Xenorhabdus szentirmaii]CDL84583.1 hypothetical protein XSR1_50001 [Xenorhabdus szentirmaii DSM 16338]
MSVIRWPFGVVGVQAVSSHFAMRPVLAVWSNSFMPVLHRGDNVSHVAETLDCSRSSVGRWINRYTFYGLEGLGSLPSGRPRR